MNAAAKDQRSESDRTELVSLLTQVRSVASRYYQLIGKPLGITGEIAEYEAAEKLQLQLLEVRTPFVDARHVTTDGSRQFQIKGRAVSAVDRYRGRVPSIKCSGEFDAVLLVLLDRTSYETLEIWEANRVHVQERLARPGSRARNERHSLSIMQFRSIAVCVWSQDHPRP
jgi:hypothetical protein